MIREFSLTSCLDLFRHTETSMLIRSAPVAFKDPMIRGSAIHIAYRILAAFFIVMGAKTSIVENLVYINQSLSYIVANISLK